MRASGKPLVHGDDRFHLGVGRQHAALELEVREAIARTRRLAQAHHGFRRQRFLVAQAEPGVVDILLAAAD